MPTQREYFQNKFMNPSNSKQSLKNIVNQASINKKYIYQQEVNHKIHLPNISKKQSFLSARNTNILSNFQQSVKKHKKSDVLMLQKIFKDIQANSHESNIHPKSQRYQNCQDNYQISMKDLKKLTKSTKWGSQAEFNNLSQVSSPYKSSRFTNRRNNSQLSQPLVNNDLKLLNFDQKRFSTPNTSQHKKQKYQKRQIKLESQHKKPRMSLPIINQSLFSTAQQKYEQRIDSLKNNYGKAMSRRDHKNIISHLQSKQKLLDIHYQIKKRMQRQIIARQLKKEELQFRKMVQQRQRDRHC